MSDEKPIASEAAAAATEDLGAKSVLVKLAPDGGLAGVGLRELEDEPAAVEIRTGPEKYQVLSTLGEGGMGKVYAVHDRDLKRPVALKMIRAGGDRDVQRRFLEEAQVMGQLQHPNILPVHELGLSEGKKLYYTMPLVRGRSLRTLLDGLRRGEEKAAGTHSLTRLVQVFLQVSQAVGYAHAKGVLHRDLKPANLMLGEHGEVQVIDWGLAKVVAGAEVKTDLAASLTRSGHIVGTPAYMSPEQATGMEEDPRTDVYALGAVLYEMLCFEPPFQGSSGEVLAAVVRDQPAPPRERSPGRAIPLDLERTCLKALAKRPEERQPSVEALHGEVQAWLEAETDRTQRHQRAEAKAAEGKALLEEYRRLQWEVERCELEEKMVRERFEPWQPIEEKAELYAAEDRAAAARRAEVQAAAAAVAALEKALGFEDDNAAARECLTDYYWDRFVEAERARDERSLAFFAERVATYHGGKYARALRGNGSLELASDPPGAEVWLSELVEEGPLLVERNRRRLGATPLEETTLAMGSYVAVLGKEGYRDTRYPVCITRNRAWKGEVRLYTAEQVGEGFIQVPAGRFVMGGDAQAWSSLPRSEPWVEDFFIGEHPVTMGEYLEFLNDVARREGIEAAKPRSPRYKADQPGSTYLLEDGEGGLKLPEVDAEGDRWELRMPALGISWHDAVAYCGWRSSRDGREYRLPSEEEWERAARGVDGRWYPWGWRFDASLCNMRESRRERAAPVVVDGYPRDVSVYGVRGLGGNVRDWTSSEDVQGTGPTRRVHRVNRGGYWDGSARSTRAAYRFPSVPSRVNDGLGFRLARSVSSL